jgi:hypothetical protein
MGWADTALLSAVMCGAALGFLRYNFNPARIFMGDCGAHDRVLSFGRYTDRIDDLYE